MTARVRSVLISSESRLASQLLVGVPKRRVASDVRRVGASWCNLDCTVSQVFSRSAAEVSCDRHDGRARSLSTHFAFPADIHILLDLHDLYTRPLLNRPPLLPPTRDNLRDLSFLHYRFLPELPKEAR
jgi:hypothetical protein